MRDLGFPGKEVLGQADATERFSLVLRAEVVPRVTVFLRKVPFPHPNHMF